jgi:hypothetical protein
LPRLTSTDVKGEESKSDFGTITLPDLFLPSIMAPPESQSDHLITLSDAGDLQQLFSALRQPSIARVALNTESVLVDAYTGVRVQELNLKRMIEAAARSGHADIVETLLRFGQQHNIAVSEMVTMDTISAALQERPLEVLLKFQAVDPDVFSRPLHMGVRILSTACHGGPNSEDLPRKKYLGLIQHLMNAGFDPNTPNCPPTYRRYRPGRLLYTACWQASSEIVGCLLAHGAIIEKSRSMRSASYNGRIDVLEALLKYGGDVNEVADCKDIDGPPGTPLHVAAAEGKEDIVSWLIDHGADLTVKNCEGRTPKDILEEKRMAVMSSTS